MNAVDARLKTILAQNGYETDIGLNVFPWRTSTLEDAELPAICCRDGDSKKYDETVGEVIRELPVEITVILASGATTPDELRAVLADVYKAIAVDVSWGGLAQDTAIPNIDNMTVEQGEKIQGGASVTISILYSTNRWEV